MDTTNGTLRNREELGLLDQRRYALHDRDTKFCSVFRATLTAGGIKPIQQPLRVEENATSGRRSLALSAVSSFVRV